MTEETAAPQAGADVWVHKAGGEGTLTPREAARSLSDARAKALAGASEEPKKEETPQESSAEAPPAQESEAKAEDAAPPEEVPGETQEAEPAELPPIEP